MSQAKQTSNSNVNRGYFACAFLLWACAISPSSVGAQSADRLASDFMENRFRAGDIIERSYAAENGAAYEDVKLLYMHVERSIFLDRAPARHDESWNEIPIVDDLHMFWDFENHRYRGVQLRRHHGGLIRHNETLLTNGDVYSILTNFRTYRQGTITLDRYHGYTAHPYHAWLAINAPKLTSMFRQTPYALTYLGEARVDRERVDVIGYTWPASPKRPRQYVSRHSGLMVAGASNFADPFEGDITNFIRYEGRKTVNGLPVPERIAVDFANGWRELRIIRDIQSLEAAPEGVFELDDDLAPAPPHWTIERVSSRVRRVSTPAGGRHYVHAVTVGGFNILMDTAPSARATQRVINLIEAETEKPVRYVVLTHGHADSFGGARAAAAHGAQVITSSAARPIVSRLIGAPGSRFARTSLRPILNPEEHIVSLDAGAEMRLEDGGEALVIHNIGDTPHAQGMLVALVDGDGVLIEGDLFTEDAPRSTTAQAFIRWVEELALDDPLVAGLRHAPIRFNDMRAADGVAPKLPDYLVAFLRE